MEHNDGVNEKRGVNLKAKSAKEKQLMKELMKRRKSKTNDSLNRLLRCTGDILRLKPGAWMEFLC